MLFSIVTATFNRANVLPRLYESLCRQDCASFEWIIVDDGSTDNTADVISGWQRESAFPIKLLSQKNSGKHRAINAGVATANSEWCAVIDSDDWISTNCLRRVKELIDENELDARRDVAALIMLSCDSDGKVIGSSFPKGVSYDRNYLFYDTHKISGDKFDFYKTAILQRFQFPEIPGERFISEGIVWNRINEEYLSCFVNEAHQFVEYQADGLTSRSFVNRARSPTGACLYYREAIARPVSAQAKMRHSSNYFRFALHSFPRSRFFLKCNPFIYCSGFVLGSALFVIDRLRMRALESK